MEAEAIHCIGNSNFCSYFQKTETEGTNVTATCRVQPRQYLRGSGKLCQGQFDFLYGGPYEFEWTDILSLLI